MNIMLDIETLSSRPDACVVAIGAATFAHDGERQIFYTAVAPSSGHIDARTGCNGGQNSLTKLARCLMTTQQGRCRMRCISFLISAEHAMSQKYGAMARASIASSCAKPMRDQTLIRRGHTVTSAATAR